MPKRYLDMILNARVYDVAHETPLDPAPNISRRLNNRVWLKREDEQPVFSFKCRGAYNKIVQLPAQALRRGVITASAGNHAQGVALAAHKFGVHAVIVMPVTTPLIKVNAVAMRDFTEDEVFRFCELARSNAFQVRFIEFMPLDGDRSWSPDQVLTGAEIRALIEERHPLEALPREPHATARVYRFADGGGGEIGFINPVSEPFCADCNRIRLTADGKLRTCLFSIRETDLRGPLRDGAGDEEVAQVIRDAVWRKELKHRVNEPGFVAPPRTMSAIGG